MDDAADGGAANAAILGDLAPAHISVLSKQAALGSLINGGMIKKVNARLPEEQQFSYLGRNAVER